MQIVFLISVLLVYLLMPNQPEKLVILSHYLIGLVGTPIAIIGVLFLAFQTDARVRMGRLTGICLVISVVVIMFCVAVTFALQRGWI